MKEWFKSRGYLHFDPQVSKIAASRVVAEPEVVAAHSFYPFIRYAVSSQKVFFDKTFKKVEAKEPKVRPISYASHMDSHIYSYYCQLLDNLYEAELASCSWGNSVLAFRSLGKSNIDFAYQAFVDISSKGECCAIALDVKGFFDNLNHNTLKQAWGKLLGCASLPADHYKVFRSLTKFSFVDRDALYERLGISKNNPRNNRVRVCTPSEFRCVVRAEKFVEVNTDIKGIPQGSPISSMLSNIYMMEFDAAVYDHVSRLGGTYYRYCDDILVIVPIGSEGGVTDFVSSQISNMRLEVQSSKTETRTFRIAQYGLRADKPLQYLGFIFDGQRIYLRSASLARYHERKRKGVWLAQKTMEKRNALRIERGQLPRSMYLKKLYSRYSYLGRRNFIAYGYRAASIMGSNSIKKQLKSHWSRLQNRIALAQE